MLNVIMSGQNYFPECTIVTEFLRLYSVCKNDPDPRYKVYMGSGHELKSNFAEILNSSVRRLADTIILKDPNLCLYIPEWQEFFPRDRMVLTIRDPRDVVASMLAVLRKTNPRADVRQAIDIVAPHFFEIEKVAGGIDNLLVVRYEDIVRKRGNTLDLLRTFTERELNLMPDLEDRFDKQNPFHTDLFGRTLSEERIGAFREALTEDEIETVWSIFCGIIDRRFRSRAVSERTESSEGFPNRLSSD